MWRSWLRRNGVLKGTLIITAAGIAASVAITTAIELAVLGAVNTIGIVLAVVVPVLVATPVNAFILHLLHKLDQTEERLRALAVLDSLTSAYNRRSAFEIAETELERVRRYGGEFAVLLLDLDHFKSVNDTHGHLAGDAVLRAVADLCRQQSRRTDTFARYGGEEFMLLMPSTPYQPAIEMAERLRGAIRALEVDHEGRSLSITASVGVAVGNGNSASVDAVIGAADAALYRAKGAGRDQVSAAEVPSLEVAELAPSEA